MLKVELVFNNTIGYKIDELFTITNPSKLNTYKRSSNFRYTIIMIYELRIKNFTIIKNLVISFKEGLNILTGETGAGKSIIVDALSMFITPRASVELISSGAKEAQIEALFCHVEDELIKKLAEELSIDIQQGLVLRRVISSQGRARAYINDTVVSIQTLVSIGNKLITIYGQHEFQSLLKKESYLYILDSYGSLQDECKEIKNLYEKSKALKLELEEIIKTIRERSQREEFLQYQLKEIDEAQLKSGELEDIQEEYSLLSNINKLRESAEDAYNNLYAVEGAVLERLKRSYNSILSIMQVDKSANEIGELIQSAIAAVEDAVSLIRSKKDSYEANPHRLEQLSDRIDLLKRLLKKYGNTIDDVLKYRDSLKQQLDNLEGSMDRHKEIERELLMVNEKLIQQSDLLSSKRISASVKLQSEINEELLNLSFKKALFSISIEKKDEISANGIDDVDFLFSANPGEPMKPLNKVASGGELSRIMLAIRAVALKIAKDSLNETVIFDEVDAGIGGNTALQIGSRLKDIADTYQTLCITHLPQIAALANNHLMIEKITLDGNTEVIVKELNEEERKFEIARMLSGVVTDTAIRHAEELITSRNKVT